MKIINTFKDKKITLLVVLLILFINITAYSQNTNDGGTTNTASTTLVEKEQAQKVSSELSTEPTIRSQKETPTNEQEDVEDLEERETRELFFIPLFVLASIAIIAGVYFRFCKLLGIELHWRVNGAIIGAISLLLFVTFLWYEGSGTYNVRLRKGVIYDKYIRRANEYFIHINYKGKIIHKAVPKSIYRNVAIGDTAIFQISNGKLGFIHYDITQIKKGYKKYVPHTKGTSKNLIPMDKVHIHNQKLLIDDLNSQVSLAENSKGHIYIEFSLSSPLMPANDIKILSGNKKVKDEFIKFISNLNNCGKVSESGKYVLYCEFDKGKIHKADLTKTD